MNILEKNMKKIALLSLMTVATATAFAQTYYTDRASFNADAAVTNPTTIDFDSYATGTDLNGATIGLATLSNENGVTPLEVISGATGVRNPMNPSSGANVLSPGGSDPTLDTDELRITFSQGVQAAGLDVVLDVPDGFSFTHFQVYDLGGNILFTDNHIPSPTGAPGYQFIGYVSDSANIGSILIRDYDNSGPDDNVAFDSITYSPVPEPATMTLLGLGALAALRKKKKKA